MNKKEKALASAGVGAIGGGGYTALSASGSQSEHELHASMSGLGASEQRFNERMSRMDASTRHASAAMWDKMTNLNNVLASAGDDLRSRLSPKSQEIWDANSREHQFSKRNQEASSKADKARKDALRFEADADSYAAQAKHLEDTELWHANQAKRFRNVKIGSYAAIGLGGAAVGGAYYLRHRRGKVEKVRMPKRSKKGI